VRARRPHLSRSQLPSRSAPSALRFLSVSTAGIRTGYQRCERALADLTLRLPEPFGITFDVANLIG